MIMMIMIVIMIMVILYLTIIIVSNSNWTELRTIQGVIARVILKLGKRVQRKADLKL